MVLGSILSIEGDVLDWHSQLLNESHIRKIVLLSLIEGLFRKDLIEFNVEALIR